jgi:hypothetical protein
MTVEHPAVLLRSVSFPVQQVLPAATPTAHIQNPPNCIGRMVINELRGWRSCCRLRQGTGADRFNQGYMKSRMDPERGWEFQVHSRGVNDTFKGTNEIGGKVSSMPPSMADPLMRAIPFDLGCRLGLRPGNGWLGTGSCRRRKGQPEPSSRYDDNGADGPGQREPQPIWQGTRRVCNPEHTRRVTYPTRHW